MTSVGGNAAAAIMISSNSQVAQNTISGHDAPSRRHPNIIAGSISGQDLADGTVGLRDVAQGAVRGAQVADNSLTGADIRESTLAQVPSAAKANDAYSTFHDATIQMPYTRAALANPIATMGIGHAGNFVVIATLDVITGYDSKGGITPTCVLTAGGDSDTQQWPMAQGQYQHATLQVVHSFVGQGGTVKLECWDSDESNSPTVLVDVERIKITAIQVNNLQNGGFS